MFNVTLGLKEGTLIKIKQIRNKRIYGEVVSVLGEQIKIKPIYKPSPKSRLRNHSVFSKNKFKLYERTTQDA